MSKLSLKYLIIFSLMVSVSYSQELVPPIQNFSPQEYNAASQNWGISQDEQGNVYVANNQGLLIFDGINWELLALDNESVIRSVFPHNDRIYTGSYQEFGYWEKTDKGCLVYNSLKHLMDDFNMQSEDFWEITSIKETIYFRSFAAVYKYKDNKITRLDDMSSNAMAAYGEKLVIAHREKGLVYVDRNGEIRILEGDLSPVDDVEFMDLEPSGDTLYLGSKKALYIYHKNKIERLEDPGLDELLSKYELNHISALNQNEIVLGTIKNGIIHYDLEKGRSRIFDRNSGLQNNTVLSISENRGKVWLALDRGIDIIDLKAPIHFYTDNTGELGAVYDVEFFQGHHYLASNTGVYKVNEDKLELINEAEDHTWNLEVIDNLLYANHNRGTFMIVEDKFVPVDDNRGSFDMQKIPGSNRLMIADYSGLSVYDPDSGMAKELPGIDFPVRQIAFENETTVWAAHAYEGLYRIKINDTSATTIEKMPALDGDANFNVKIYKVNNQVLIYAGDEWYRHNPFKDRIEKFHQLEEFNGHRLIKKTEDYMFVDSSDGSIVFTDLNDEKLIIGPERLNHRLVKANENITRLNDSLAIISLNDGFAYVNLVKLKEIKEQEWISTPYIKAFIDDRSRYSLMTPPVVPYSKARNISIQAALPFSDATHIRYILSGEESLRGNMESGQLNLRNLDYGDYELQLSALGVNEVVESQKFFFSIAPPWYFSIWMKIIYALGFLALIYLVFWLNRQKLRKHQLKLEEKFEKEHTERLNRLEKERLMNEIDLKRKELANSTMIAAKKNEVLMEIQGELNKDKTKFSNQYRLKHIMNKINNAVKSKDEWQIFETNFNEVHEDFFKDLLDSYPKLTSKDLKLCSYLKMNLSSKEIAPLMGISVRGVEVHRYRLRKKMALKSDVNLSKFLIKNF